MSQVLACIDASVSAPSVVDYAAWAALRMSAPLTFLHVLDEQRYPHVDLNGHIGRGSREELLNELASLDVQRNRLALEDGRILLEEARQRAHSAGIPIAETQQRHGDLLHSLAELQGDTQLLVMGRQGERSGGCELQIGSQLENVIRAVPGPILVAPITFRIPRRLMLAFDGSVTTPPGGGNAGFQPPLRRHADPSGADRRRYRRQLGAAGQRRRTSGVRRL